jgi:uncharacterized protein YraI
VTNVFAVVGQHRVESARLLLLGEDGRYYAYAADGRPVQVTLSTVWLLDGDRPTETVAEAEAIPEVTVVELPRRRRNRSILALVAGLLLGLLVLAPSALAHAPGLATALSNLTVREAPSADATVVTELPAGTTVELTGNAAGDFIEVLFDGRPGWASVALLDAGGLETATIDADAALRTEPNAGGTVLLEVPAGSTVILTGAAVDGYLAATFAGTGGWVSADAVN